MDNNKNNNSIALSTLVEERVLLSKLVKVSSCKPFVKLINCSFVSERIFTCTALTMDC